MYVFNASESFVKKIINTSKYYNNNKFIRRVFYSRV